MLELTIQSLRRGDREWVTDVLSDAWGSALVVSRGVLLRADRLPGLVALTGAERVGLLTYSPGERSCEIVTLNALLPRRGIGRGLLAEMIDLARRESWGRLWLVTTNDNVAAQRFYEACGWELTEIHRGAVGEARKLKPQIPLTGQNGLPIEDEYEYEFAVD